MSARYDKLAAALKSALPAERIDPIARLVAFIRRLREVHASLFVWSVVMSRFGHGRPGFEQARQWFVRLGGADLWRRPFQVRFKSPSAVRLFERAFTVAVETLRAHRRQHIRHPLAKYFTDVIAVDCTAIQLSTQLVKTFPPGGRPRIDGSRPAMMKVLLCLSLFGLVPIHASLHRGLRNDTHTFPEVDLFVRGSLVLFDRGFFWKKHLKAMVERGVHFLFPMKKYCTPKIVGIAEAPKYVRRAFVRREVTRLRDVLDRNARVSSRWDLDVLIDDEIPARLVIVPGPNRTQRAYLTTIARSAWSPRAIAELYRLRWQIELVFKELKQDLNLTRVPTSDPFAAQVFVWASLVALAVSRTISAIVYPATDRLGLADPARPSLITRALRGTARLLGYAWTVGKRLRTALLRVVFDEIRRELAAITRSRADSFARLESLAIAPS